MSAARFLIVGPSWVGDMVMAQSLFKVVAARHANAAIDVVAPAWSLPVLERMPEVRRGIGLDAAHGELGIGKRRRLGVSLRNAGYTRAIVLPRSFKSALVPWFARVPLRTGYRGESRFVVVNDQRPLDRARLDQTVRRFVALGLEPGEFPDTYPLPSLTTDAGRLAMLVAELGVDRDRPRVALLPGAEYGPAKCWPLASFAALARELDDAGYATLVLGSERDRPAGDLIAANSSAVNLCGRTTLADAIDLLSGCAHAVTNDSGLMHVAAAVGIRVHALYGSSTPGYTPPLTPRRVVHYRGLSCSPCFARSCPLGHLDCLQGIEVATVLRGIREVVEDDDVFADKGWPKAPK